MLKTKLLLDTVKIQSEEKSRAIKVNKGLGSGFDLKRPGWNLLDRAE
ncbi:hypothetical protein [Kordiimonas sp. SCSIO 12610]|nr:hypothetical protein [Kordiimonas sp. SCSIO 12610]UTW56317.1 hypothetical protein KFF44_05285 [Kordiimonas sp. SCSIO 12610]